MEPRTRRRGLVALAFSLLFAVGVWTGARPEIGAATDSVDPDIVLRADFESHVNGWHATRATLRTVSGTHFGRSALVTGARGVRSFALSLTGKAGIATVVDGHYSAGIFVRSARRTRICLSLRERAGAAVVAQARTCRLVGSRWHSVVVVGYAARAGDHRLELAVTTSLRSRTTTLASRTLLVDRVVVRCRKKSGSSCSTEGGGTTTGSGTTTAPATTSAATTTGAVTTTVPTTTTGTTTAPGTTAPRYSVRGVYDRDFSATGFDDEAALGFNYIDSGPSRDFDELAAHGLKGFVWLGGYSNDTCSFNQLDDWVRSHVAAIAGNPGVGAYFIDDEPDAAKCPTAPAQMRARSDLVKSIDPAATTFLVTYKIEQFRLFAGTVDILGLDKYPCSISHGCDYSKIDAEAAEADRLGVRYWGVIQAHGDSWYKVPTVDELHQEFEHWRQTNMEGYLVFAWRFPDDMPENWLANHPELQAQLAVENAR
jgi:hypothetical protein